MMGNFEIEREKMNLINLTSMILEQLENYKNETTKVYNKKKSLFKVKTLSRPYGLMGYNITTLASHLSQISALRVSPSSYLHLAKSSTKVPAPYLLCHSRLRLQ